MKRTEFRGRVLSGGKMLRVVDGDGGGALAEAGRLRNYGEWASKSGVKRGGGMLKIVVGLKKGG